MDEEVYFDIDGRRGALRIEEIEVCAVVIARRG